MGFALAMRFGGRLMRLGRMAMSLGSMFGRGGVFAFSVCFRGGTVGFRRLFMVLSGLCMGLFRHCFLHGPLHIQQYTQDGCFSSDTFGDWGI